MTNNYTLMQSGLQSFLLVPGTDVSLSTPFPSLAMPAQIGDCHAICNWASPSRPEVLNSLHWNN